jgi:hypothetical protein
MVVANGRLVSCHSCGTKNRVPRYSFRRLPWCGSCGAALSESRLTTIARRLYQTRYPIVVITGLGLFLIWESTVASIDLSNPTAAANSSPPQIPKNACATRPQPNEGLYARYTRYPDAAPLTLKTASGSNYFVKINDAVSGRQVLTFFLYGGSIFEAQVPRGAFIVKYATGGTWCGDSELFGASTETNKADKVFQFDEDHEYTIELIARRNGNLPTKRISRDIFNADG